MLILNYDQNSVRTQFKNYFNLKIQQQVTVSNAKTVNLEDIGKSTRKVVYLDDDSNKNNLKNLLKDISNNGKSDVLSTDNNKFKNKLGLSNLTHMTMENEESNCSSYLFVE